MAHHRATQHTNAAAIACLLPLLAIASHAAPPATPQDPPRGAPTDQPKPADPTAIGAVFPHLAINPATRTIEVEAFVPIPAEAPPEGTTRESLKVYLEQVMCLHTSLSGGSKEHESLLSTKALALHLHTALLMVEALPGTPAKGQWLDDGTYQLTQATGTPLKLTLNWNDANGAPQEATPLDWIIHAQTREHPDDADFVFAGSQRIKVPVPGADPPKSNTHYGGDWEGTAIGLASFGTEVIAWTNAFSHESAIAEPQWIADLNAVPPFGTPVTLRITVVVEDPNPAQDPPAQEKTPQPNGSGPIDQGTNNP